METPLLALPLLLAACDPGGPGASGTITLGNDAEPSAFNTLILAAYGNAGDTFDPAVLEDPPSPTDFVLETWDLANIDFPWDYVLSYGVGTSGYPDWRIVGWFSTDDTAAAPGATDPVGTATFEIGECGAFFGGYCDVTSGVDFAIDAVIAR
jgi:hypothetical protein